MSTQDSISSLPPPPESEYVDELLLDPKAADELVEIIPSFSSEGIKVAARLQATDWLALPQGEYGRFSLLSTAASNTTRNPAVERFLMKRGYSFVRRDEPQTGFKYPAVTVFISTPPVPDRTINPTIFQPTASDMTTNRELLGTLRHGKMLISNNQNSFQILSDNIFYRPVWEIVTDLAGFMAAIAFKAEQTYQEDVSTPEATLESTQEHRHKRALATANVRELRNTLDFNLSMGGPLVIALSSPKQTNLLTITLREIFSSQMSVFGRSGEIVADQEVTDEQIAEWVRALQDQFCVSA